MRVIYSLLGIAIVPGIGAKRIYCHIEDKTNIFDYQGNVGPHAQLYYRPKPPFNHCLASIFSHVAMPSQLIWTRKD